MKCFSCGSNELQVITTVPNELKNYIKRRRECLKCGARFTTQEDVRPMEVKESSTDVRNRR